MRLGIFGGTFNPPHFGHLIVAERAVEALGLDKLLFVPAAIPPHKIGEVSIAPNGDRVAMLLRAIAGQPVFDISTIEIDRPGVSFTIDTVNDIARSYPTAELFLLMGADNLADFHTWRDPDGICALTRLVPMHRNGIDLGAVDPRWKKHIVPVRTPVIEISGTEIRDRVRAGKHIGYLAPADVVTYIMDHGLYRAAAAREA